MRACDISHYKTNILAGVENAIGGNFFSYLKTLLFVTLWNKEISLFYIFVKYELYIESFEIFTRDIVLLLLSGAFLIPYTIMLCFVGLPVFFIELSVGQYSASGPMTVFEASPIFQGVCTFLEHEMFVQEMENSKIMRSVSTQGIFCILVIFSGVGAGMVIISFIGSIYYNMIIAWALYYMFASFQSVLPWQGCNHDYNTECKHLEIL